MQSFRLTTWNDRLTSSVLASNADDALVKLASSLRIDRPEICPHGQVQYQLELLSDDWSQVEETWDVVSVTTQPVGDDVVPRHLDNSDSAWVHAGARRVSSGNQQLKLEAFT
jgi:hypothetical protein